MRELDTLNASTLIETTQLFPESEFLSESLDFQGNSNAHCELELLPVSPKDSQVDLSLPVADIVRSPLRYSDSRFARTARSSNPLLPSSAADSTAMIEVPSPTKFLVHSNCSAELDPLDFKDVSGSTSSDEDVFLPDSTDSSVADSQFLKNRSVESPNQSAHCSSWRWYKMPFSNTLCSSSHSVTNEHSPGGRHFSSSVSEATNFVSSKLSTSKRHHPTSESMAAHTLLKEDCTPTSTYPTLGHSIHTSLMIPAISVPATSGSPSPSNINSPTGDAKKNINTAYSVHVERLKVLSAFCALRSRGFSEQIIDKLCSDHSHAVGCSEHTARAVVAPSSIQRCEFKWLLCILISAPIDPIRNLSPLIQRISPSLELTTKFRLPWHNTSNRRLQFTNRYQSEGDSERCRSSRMYRSSDREDISNLPFSRRAYMSKQRDSRVADKVSCLSSPQDEVPYHVIPRKYKSVCDEHRDRKTYAAVAAAAVVNSGSLMNRVGKSPWMTPVETSLHEGDNHTAHGKKYQSDHDNCSANSVCVDRSQCKPIHPDEILNKHHLSASVNSASADSRKVSIVSARMTKEPPSGFRNVLPSHGSPWHVPPVPCPRRNPYLVRSVPANPRVSHGYTCRPSFHSMTCDVFCPANPVFYHNSHSHPSVCDYVPRKTKSYDECCMSFNVSSDNSHTKNAAQELQASSSNPASGVFVDLTGYDVTVSVERLPPITDCPTRQRGSGRRYTVDGAPGPALPAPPYSSCEPHRMTYDHCYPLPTAVPVSPPPPYSECAYSSPVSSSSKSYSEMPWQFSVHPTSTTMKLQQTASATMSSALPPHSLSISDCDTQPWIPCCPSSLTPYVFTGVCPCQSAPMQLQWLASQSFDPLVVCSCGAQLRPFGPYYCPIRGRLHNAMVDYSTLNERGCATEYVDHHFGFTADDFRHRPNFQRQNSCPEGPLSMPCNDKHSVVNHFGHSNITTPLNMHYATELNSLPFLPNQTTHGAPNGGWVYVPEPIRVPRSQDVYNALRTCLVPHYELRDCEYFDCFCLLVKDFDFLSKIHSVDFGLLWLCRFGVFP